MSIHTVKLDRPIESLRVVQTPTIVVDVPASSMVLQEDSEQGTFAELENQKQQYAAVLQTLEALALKMQIIYEKAIIEHRQAIAKLAVEIARKILVQKVKDGDYQIESIIQEALNNAPTRQDVVVRLNPQDFTRCQQLQQQGEAPAVLLRKSEAAGEAAFAGIKFVADAGIGPAQCVVETPKGKVESLIDEHLEQVGRALSKAI